MSHSILHPGALDVIGATVPPSLVALLLSTLAVYAAVYASRPPFPQTAVFGFVPWIVAGLLLTVLGSVASYPPILRPLATAPASYLLCAFVAGIAWLAMLQLSVSRGSYPPFHHYLGAMGAGVVAILLATLILHAGPGIVAKLALLFVIADVAILATGLISITVWFWSPDFVDYTKVAGGFAIFGTIVYGVASTAVVAVVGATGHTVLSATFQEIVVTLVPSGVAGIDATHLWVWLFLAASAAVGIHVATQLARYADRSPHAVNAMLGSAGIGGFGLGLHRLLLVVI